MNLFQPSELLKFLESIGQKPTKRLSQNFLIDGNILKKIVESANISEGDLVIEIGPGPGVLTEALLKKGAKVVAIEKDSGFAKALKRLEEKAGTLEVFEEDVLKFPLEEVLRKNLKKNQKAKVISNLPYHLTSPIFSMILPLHEWIETVIVMIQKEVAERITSKEGSKAYSSFSIFCQFYSNPKLLFSVSPGCFFPKPKVVSAVIECKLKAPSNEIDEARFFEFIKTLFCMRRKMICTSLKGTCYERNITQALQKLEIDEKVRPEQLSLADLISIFQTLN